MAARGAEQGPRGLPSAPALTGAASPRPLRTRRPSASASRTSGPRARSARPRGPPGAVVQPSLRAPCPAALPHYSSQRASRTPFRHFRLRPWRGGARSPSGGERGRGREMAEGVVTGRVHPARPGCNVGGHGAARLLAEGALRGLSRPALTVRAPGSRFVPRAAREGPGGKGQPSDRALLAGGAAGMRPPPPTPIAGTGLMEWAALGASPGAGANLPRCCKGRESAQPCAAVPSPAEHRGAGTDPPSPLPGHREARRGHCPLLIVVKGCLDA